MAQYAMAGPSAEAAFTLLCSPLLLRVLVGLTIVTGTETDFAHRLIAWASWLVPWFLFEVGRKCHEAARSQTKTPRLHTA